MEYVKLKEVCEISMGQSPDSSSYNKEMIGVPFFQGNADFGEKNPDVRAWTTKPRKMALINDILISVRAPIGALNYANKNCCIGRGLASIRPIKDFYLKEYIFYLLKSKKDELNKLGTGSTFKAINKSVLENLKVPILNVNDQTKIVKQLDMIKHIIKKEKTQISFFDDLIKSRFVEMFGDPIRNTQNRPTTELINVVKMQRGFDLPVHNRRQDGNIPVYGSNGILDYHNEAKIQGGGIITGRSGTIGKVFYTQKDYWPLNTSLFSVEMHGNNVIYLAYLLHMFDLTRFVEGTGIPTLNRNMFHKKQIINVSINEQEQFASFVEQVNKSKFVVQKSIDELQTLYDSLMQKYFG